MMLFEFFFVGTLYFGFIKSKARSTDLAAGPGGWVIHIHIVWLVQNQRLRL
jgi:hypothetical protein